MTIKLNEHRTFSAARHASAALLSLALVAGMTPVAWADSDPGSGAVENAAQNEQNENQNSDASSNSNSNANNASNQNANNQNADKNQSSNTGDAANAAATTSATASDEDPYAHTYEASKATAGESAGSVSWLSADSAQEAAVLQARETYSSASCAVLVPADGGAEVLCAAALAGVCNAPLLFTDAQGNLGESTAALIRDLGATRVYAVGVSDAATLAQIGDLAVTRLNGATPADVSLAVLRQGVAEGFWKPVAITLANGDDTFVANAAAALAYKQAQPVLLTNSDGALTSSERMYFSDKSTNLLGLTHVQVIAADDSVQQQAADALSLFCCENKGCANIEVVGGSDACAVSQNANTVLLGGMPDWTKSVVVNPDQASSATAGIMALRQGGAAVSTWYDALSAWAQSMANSGETALRFSGEGSVVDSSVSLRMRAAMGIYTVETYEAGISIVDMAKKEVERYIEDGKATRKMDEVLESMDPGLASRGSEFYYLFAKLGEGYSGAVTAEQLDGFIDSIAGTYEASYGCTSVLRGQGQAFIDAAKEQGVNEVYLLAHAILESACGCSSLARGNAGGMNMFGIGAYDSNPNNGGSYALSQGWDSAEASVKGGGAWIASNYIHSSYGQDTLYQMRWNVSAGSHQYATSLTWAKSIAKLMNRFYEYAGISLEHTGLNFKVIVYPEQ